MSGSHPTITNWDQILRPVTEALLKSGGRPCLTGMSGSTPGFALTLLARSHGAPAERSWMIVGDSDESAERLYDDLLFFHAMLGFSTDALGLFPEWETLPYETTPPHVDLIGRRMRTLHRLMQRERTILVTSVPALMQRLLPLRVFAETRLRCRPGDSLEREVLSGRLLRLGYRRTSVVEVPGEFSVRGGIVDVYSTAYADPLRLEFLGDTIESIRLFDQTTQKSTGKLDAAWVLPAREYLVPPESGEGLGALPPDAEWRSPDLYPEMATLLDYFPDVPLLALVQPAGLARKADEFWREVEEAYLRRGEPAHAEAYPTPDRLYLHWNHVDTRLSSWSAVALEPLTESGGNWQPAVTFPSQPLSTVGLGVRGTPFTETLATLDHLRQGGSVVLVARSRGQVDRLLALFAEQDLPADVWHSRQWTARLSGKAPLALIHGDLSAGFVSAEGRLTIVTEDELFAKGLRHRPPAKSKTATFISSLEDLEVGGYVVHVQHGIARYQGLRRLEVQGFESDFLILEFAGGDKLYVPLDRLNHVQRYTGAEGHVLRLDKLGGTSWGRTTARIKKEIEDMAKELVELYASREVVQRGEYASDSALTHAFEAAFEYEETPDQLRAIEDIKRDLEAAKPMDRLVCGDVGYGKTEVAMRAAFKAVETGRQVAVLVPTTLLAHQHYENFSQRFAPFPARVAMLSRFQSPKESKAVLKELAAGTVDIVIGTHRLLQRDIQFRSLGLVIIDEEQWFGVRHKERLKQLRTQVDVLTLTATPIPRTLQMAMTGVRDLSVIETPPAGRLSIRSQVLRFKDSVIREAIIRELGRGGQVFFVHNRVETMEKMGAWLQQLVPEARFVMAHGQMDEKLLESVMLKFFHREADVLIASAIIQSGLDVPNANTILVNRADMFGLAQLYQLRGRVGRAGHQAYAYFMIPDEGALTPDAQKRLQAIQEYAELGSGFRIAAADLEIRGAGNLLGKQQSGHIAAVGLDLYMQMVEQAVRNLRGQVIDEPIDPTLHLPVSAFIPEEYVGDSHHRLSLYKRLSSSMQVGELALLHGEIQDRFGPLPEPVERLLEVMQIRVLAKTVRLSSLEVKDTAAIFTFDPKSVLPEAGIRKLIDQYRRRFRLLTPLSFELALPHSGWSMAYPELTTALQTLAVCDTTSRKSPL